MMNEETVRQALEKWVTDQMMQDDLLSGRVPGVTIERGHSRINKREVSSVTQARRTVPLRGLDVESNLLNDRYFFERRLEVDVFNELARNVADDISGNATTTELDAQNLLLALRREETAVILFSLHLKESLGPELQTITPNARFSRGLCEDEVMLIHQGRCEYAIGEPVLLEPRCGPDFQVLLNSTVWCEQPNPDFEVTQYHFDSRSFQQELMKASMNLS